jgi:hypothetical protein
MNTTRYSEVEMAQIDQCEVELDEIDMVRAAMLPQPTVYGISTPPTNEVLTFKGVISSMLGIAVHKRKADPLGKAYIDVSLDQRFEIQKTLHEV